MTGVGSSPALVICGTSQVLLAGVSGGFPGILPFRPTYRLARLDMSNGSNVYPHWSVIEHRTRKQDIEVGNYTAQNLENMADLHGES